MYVFHRFIWRNATSHLAALRLVTVSAGAGAAAELAHRKERLCPIYSANEVPLSRVCCL